MIRSLIAAISLTFCVAFPAAAATTSSTDYSDLWYNAAESGWGAGLYQQGDTLFMTLYVYASDGSGTWFVAPDLRRGTGSSTMFSGALYRVTGPPFAGAFTVAGVAATAVGSASITFASPTSGTLSYSTGEANVTKSITRQTWRTASIAGNYLGGMSTLASACYSNSVNGPYEILGAVAVQQTGTAVNLRIDTIIGIAAHCLFSGTYSQAGRHGTIQGNFTCTANPVIHEDERITKAAESVGTFTVDRIEAGPNGMYGQLNAKDQYCTYTGRLGGTRVVP